MTTHDRLTTEKESLMNHEQNITERLKQFSQSVDELKATFTTEQDQLQQQLSSELKTLLDVLNNIHRLMTTVKSQQIKKGAQDTEATLSKITDTLEQSIHAMNDQLSREKESLIATLSDTGSSLTRDINKSLNDSIKKPLEHSLTETQEQLTQSLARVTEDIIAFLSQEQEVIKHEVTATFDNIESDLQQLEDTTKELTSTTNDVETSLERMFHQLEGHLEGTELHLTDEIQAIETSGENTKKQLMEKVDANLQAILTTVTRNIEQLNKNADEALTSFNTKSAELQQSQHQQLQSQAEQINDIINEHLSRSTVDIERLVADVRRQFRSQVYDELEQILNSFVALQDIVTSQLDEVMARLKNAQVEIKAQMEKMLHHRLQSINQIGEQFEITIEKSLRQVMTQHSTRASEISTKISSEVNKTVNQIQEDSNKHLASLHDQLQRHVDTNKKINEELRSLLQKSVTELKTVMNSHETEFLSDMMTHLNSFKEKYNVAKKTALNEAKETVNQHSQELLSVLNAIEQRAEIIANTHRSSIQEQKIKFEQQIARGMEDVDTRVKTIEQEALNSVIHDVERALSTLNDLIQAQSDNAQQEIAKITTFGSERVESILDEQQKALNNWLTDVKGSLQSLGDELRNTFTRTEHDLDANLKKMQQHVDSLKQQQASLLDLQKTVKSTTTSELERIKNSVSTALQEISKSLKDTIRAMNALIQAMQRTEPSA